MVSTTKRVAKKYTLLHDLPFYMYPAIMIVGSLAGCFAQETYFSDKRNFLNQYFVKQGWLWTTLVLLTIICLRLDSRKHGINRPPQSTILKQTLLRYGLATIWWVLFTQWFFGAPLMDRVFTLSGGGCFDRNLGSISKSVLTSRVCRQRGGIWTGGHDPSGHFFIIIHSSLFTYMELLPILYNFESYTSMLKRVVLIPAIFLVLSAWMLLMTSVYFHVFWEKLTGLAFGLLEGLLVYKLDSPLLSLMGTSNPAINIEAEVGEVPSSSSTNAERTHTTPAVSRHI